MGELKYRSLRGMPDIIGEDADKMRFLEGIAREIFASYGFREIRTPILEPTAVFVTGVGESTDIVEKEMYSFTDRGGKDISLRPEGTAPIIRAFIEHGMDNAPDVSRFFYSGPMFRGERPQKGRLRQFHQIGAEVIGTYDTFADAELIMTLENILKRLGVKGHEILINSLGCPEDRKKYANAVSGYFKQKVEGLCEDCGRRLGSNVLRILDCKRKACREITSEAPAINGFLCGECDDSYEKLKELLVSQCVPFTERKDLVRGLDYYTGIIFEVAHPSLGAQDSVAAGGRYDGLSLRMGGSDVGATGYAIGVERLLLIVSEDIFPKPIPSAYFIPVEGTDKKECFHLLEKIRKEGIMCDMDLTGRSFKAQMRKAGKDNRHYVVFVERSEEHEYNIQLKNMKTGEQRPVRVEELAVALKEGTVI